MSLKVYQKDGAKENKPHVHCFGRLETFFNRFEENDIRRCKKHYAENVWKADLPPSLQERRLLVPGLQSQLVRSLETT